MALAERLTPEQAAVVFRRAAELQTAGLRGAAEAAFDDATLDDAALEEIGREVGLSPVSIRAALAELRSEVVAPGPAMNWGTVVRCRTVRGARVDVVNFLDDQARQNLLTVVRGRDDTTVWAPHSGPAAAVVRGLRGRHRYPLLAFKELRVTVTETGANVVRVCLDGSLRFPSGLMSLRSQAVSMLGIAGGALLAFRVGGLGHTDWTFDTAGTFVALAGTGVGLRAYRRAVGKAETALADVLDRATFALFRSDGPQEYAIGPVRR
jgi:hypothetical protein